MLDLLGIVSFVRMFMNTHNESMFVHVYVRTYVCTYVCMYGCTYVCMYWVVRMYVIVVPHTQPLKYLAQPTIRHQLEGIIHVPDPMESMDPLDPKGRCSDWVAKWCI